ncbi:MAG TPA: immunity 22 family protein [Gemmataceae bacterium]|nr:immunity 22 family protein [Gemmataceae bacterium]
MPAPAIDHFRRDHVSLWVGSFPDPGAADAYFTERYDPPHWEPAPFSVELGPGFYPPWALEINFEGTIPRPLVVLLHDATFAVSFLDRAVIAAERMGIREAQGVALLYDFDYRLAPTWAEGVGPLRFVGTFAFVRTAPNARLEPFRDVADRIGYSPGAVLSVVVALEELTKRRRQDDAAAGGHVSARELCEHLLTSRGADSPAIVREFGLDRSEDVGRVIFALIDAGLARRQVPEAEPDFRGLYRLSDR